MYTILICDDGNLYGSHKEKIMQREKLFHKLCFLIPPYYNGYDMSQCTVTMRYLLPISKKFVTETLVLSEEKYKDHLMYILPVDSNLTKEWGDIKLNLTFTMLDVDINGNIIQRVRKTEDYALTITQLPDWDSVIPDESLSALDQRILKQDAQIKALESLANAFDSNQVDNLVYDSVEDTLQLSAKGVGIGNKVSVKEMLDDGIPVVNFGSNLNDDSDDDNNHNDGCGCGCEDNVVEFGDSDTIVETTEEDNVVEF